MLRSIFVLFAISFMLPDGTARTTFRPPVIYEWCNCKCDEISQNTKYEEFMECWVKWLKKIGKRSVKSDGSLPTVSRKQSLSFLKDTGC